MYIPALNLGEYDFPARNRRAAEIIENFATRHAAFDISIGLAGFLPLPGAGTAAIVAELFAQVPRYRTLATELSFVYQTPAIDLRQGVVRREPLTEAGERLIAVFNRKFVEEACGHLLADAAFGAVLGAIPILGGLVNVGLTAAVWSTMTWQVGTMAAIFFHNGGQWIGSPVETYTRAAEISGGLSLKVAVPAGILDRIPNRVEEVRRFQVQQTCEYVETLQEAARAGVAGGTLSRSQLRKMLLDRGYPEAIVDASIDSGTPDVEKHVQPDQSRRKAETSKTDAHRMTNSRSHLNSTDESRRYQHEQRSKFVQTLLSRRHAPEEIRDFLREHGLSDDVADEAHIETLENTGKLPHTPTLELAESQDVLPEELAKQLLERLPTDQGKEKRLEAFRADLREFRVALREELENDIRGFIQSLRPAAPKQREILSPAEKQSRVVEKTRHVDLINGVLKSFNFGIWCKGKLCELRVYVTTSHPAGEVRLVPEGSSVPVEASVHLWNLSDIEVVDALSPPPAKDPTPSEPAPRHSRAHRPRDRRRGGGRHL